MLSVRSTKQFLTQAAALVSVLVVGASAYYTGDGTAYTLGSTQSGNCNFMYANSDASTDYVAINSAQWDGLANCGRCVEVSCIDSKCTNKTTKKVLQILDQCPECSEGDLDISSSVYTALTGSTPSRLKVQWQFVDCPITGNIQYCLKTGSNNYYVAIQPANSMAAIKSLTINGQATTMVSSAYYYYIDASSPSDLSSIKVVLTSTSGEVITDTVSLTAGSCTEGKSQFTVSTASGSGSSSTVFTGSASSSNSTSSSTPATTTATPATTSSTSTTPATTTATPATTSSTSTTTTTPTTTTPTSATVDSESASTSSASTSYSTPSTPTATTATPSTQSTETSEADEASEADDADDASEADVTSASVDSTTSKCNVRRSRRN